MVDVLKDVEEFLSNENFSGARSVLDSNNAGHRPLFALVDVLQYSNGNPNYRKVLGAPQGEPITSKKLRKWFRARGALIHPDKLKSKLAHSAFTKLSTAVNELAVIAHDQGEPGTRTNGTNTQSPPEPFDRCGQAYAWWEEWFPDSSHPWRQPGPAQRAQMSRTDSTDAIADRQFLSALDQTELHQETVKRKAAVMEVLAGTTADVSAASAQRRHKRARTALLEKQAAGGPKVQPNSAGGFLR